MRLAYLFILLNILTISVSQELMVLQDSCCLSRFRGQKLADVDTFELAKDYRRLSKQGDLCCDNWHSDLHVIMLYFEKIFGKQGTPITKIIKYMGMPDGTEKELDYVALELEDNEKALVYFWRSYRDFLYFVYEADKVKYVKWFTWED